MMKRILVIVITLLCVANISVAQIRPVYDRGVMGLGQLLKRLNTSAAVLMIGAHPDDEDTALLTYLARGENARTAYLSLTRGDGGQNILGQELGETLGLIRTEELIQARKLDGAEQFFGRAYDYGFSKTLAEARQKWNEKVILCDTVRIIRLFRPQVVVSQFSGTSADGHGQHQFAGYISPLAVRAAEDPGQCEGEGKPWKVAKFYMRQRGAGQPTVTVNTGRYDPLLGRSYFEIAMEARSQHRSQEQGVLELKGEQVSNLKLVGSDVTEKAVFEGIDTSLESGVMADEIAKAVREFNVNDPSRITSSLAKAYGAARSAAASVADAGEKRYFENKLRDLQSAIQIAAGIQIDALSDRETYIPGDTMRANVKVFVASKNDVKFGAIAVTAPQAWTVSNVEPPRETAQGFFRRDVGDHFGYYDIKIPAGEPVTEPYWLAEPRSGDMFSWPAADPQRGMPVHRPIPAAAVSLDIAGTSVRFDVPFEFRYADDTRGEIRRNVNIVPKVSVELDQALLIVPSSGKAQTRRVVLTVTNNSSGPVAGTAGLKFAGGQEWNYSTPAPAFDLKRRGETATIPFDVTVPARAAAGNYRMTGYVRSDNSETTETMYTVQYPHIQTHRIYKPAAADAKVFDLRVAPVRVGYVAGSGDRVPEAIRQMGLTVDVIDDQRLLSGDLSAYDVIVLGIRASEVRPDFVANNTRLLDYARNGGTLVVQYQRPVYAQQGMTPYPAQMGPRVADENAPVRIAVPEHPIFDFPNKITNDDFSGWVQERNLYNFSTMDPKYVGLLESHDPGEPENLGGLVVADLGKGKYVYCSYSFFRQLPAGVPGAYRLLANILALGSKRQR